MTKQIAALEQELGVKLFYRTTRQVQLTPAGSALRDDFAQINRQINDQNRIGYTVISSTEIFLAASRATLLVMANDRESYHAVFDS